MVRLLVATNTSIDLRREEDGVTALMVACQNGHISVVKDQKSFRNLALKAEIPPARPAVLLKPSLEKSVEVNPSSHFTNQARTMSTKINFLALEAAGWGGGLPREGVGGHWGSKSSCPPSKVCLPWVSREGTWDVPGVLPGCPGPRGVFKKFVQKNFVLF